MKPNYKQLYETALNEKESLKKELLISNDDWELGKKSPKDLAIKWLCRAISVSAYDWQNHDLLLKAVDRLLMLDNAQNVKDQSSCRNCNCHNRENISSN